MSDPAWCTSACTVRAPSAGSEVMGSRRKVRSRVHGGVKEPRARLLFAPPPPHLPSSFLQEDVSSVPQRPHLATSPQTRTTCLFFCVYETFPDRTQQHHHVSRCCQFSAFHPTSAPAQFFCLQPPRGEVLLPVYTFTGSPSSQHNHAALFQRSISEKEKENAVQTV